MSAPVQASVAANQGFGVPGDFYDDSPRRVAPYILASADPTYNVFARAFCVVSEGVVAAGNTLGSVFAGFLVNPKAQALVGVTGNPFPATLTLPNNVPAELCTMGKIVVSLPATANIGDNVIADSTTGALSTIAPGVALPTGKFATNAVVSDYTVTVAGLAVITITDVPVRPVAASESEGVE